MRSKNVQNVKRSKFWIDKQRSKIRIHGKRSKISKDPKKMWKAFKTQKALDIIATVVSFHKKCVSGNSLAPKLKKKLLSIRVIFTKIHDFPLVNPADSVYPVPTFILFSIVPLRGKVKKNIACHSLGIFIWCFDSKSTELIEFQK